MIWTLQCLLATIRIHNYSSGKLLQLFLFVSTTNCSVLFSHPGLGPHR